MTQIDYEWFNKVQAHIEKEAENWPTYPMHHSGPDFPATPVPMIPATIAEGIFEKWLEDKP